MVPVELARFTVIFVPPVQTGLGVLRDAEPPTGAATTVNGAEAVVYGLHTEPTVAMRTDMLVDGVVTADGVYV
jgi:hypothetical protein